jgi:DNA-binding CsgD family transcriptional regulator
LRAAFTHSVGVSTSVPFLTVNICLRAIPDGIEVTRPLPPTRRPAQPGITSQDPDESELIPMRPLPISQPAIDPATRTDGRKAAVALSAARTVASNPSRTAGASHAPGPVLTPRELQVLKLVAQGLTNRDIAQRLVLSEHTVRRHLANIFRKLNLSSRAAAAAWCAHSRLV